MVKLLEKLSKKPILIMIIVVIATLFSVFEIKNNIRFETNLDKYMPKDNPAFIFNDQVEDLFKIKSSILFVIENPNGVFCESSLRKVKEITEKLKDLPQIERENVNSLYTLDNIISSESGLDINKFYKEVPTSYEELQKIRLNVISNEMVVGRMLSKDESATLILAQLKDDAVFTKELYNEILKIAEENKGPENIYVAGRPIIEGTLAQLAPNDMKKMIPIVILLIILVMLIVLRSFKSLLIALLIPLLSMIWTFGLMAAIKIPIYAVSTMIPVMLIAIGIAYSVYLFNNIRLYRSKNPNADKYEVIRDMLTSLWKPILMSALTTAISFISLITSEVWPVKFFGLFTAFGVISAFFLSLVFLPAALNLFGLPKQKITKEKKDNSIFFEKIVHLILKYKFGTLTATTLAVIISFFGVQKVWIDTSFIRNFEKDNEIVQADRFMNAHFAGTTLLNVILEGDDDTFKDPMVWKYVDSLQIKLEELPEVGMTFSLRDYLKKMNKAMHYDSTEYNRIPESSDLLAQFLLLYSMAGNPDNLDKAVDYNYKRANLSINLKGDNSKIVKNVIDFIDKNSSTFKGISIKYAGSAYKGLVFSGLILEGQVTSILISFVLVIILLSIMFRSFSVGLIGSIPVLLTSLITFGLMGLINVPLGATTALVASIALGIGVDFAIQFLYRYKVNSIYDKDNVLIIIKTMAHTGRAIFYNAIVIIAGFNVLLLSSFPPNRDLGALISMDMLLCFFGTLVIMLIFIYMANPHALLLGERRSQNQQK